LSLSADINVGAGNHSNQAWVELNQERESDPDWRPLRTADFYLDLDMDQDDFVYLSRYDNEIVTKAAEHVGQPAESRPFIYRELWVQCGRPMEGEGYLMYEFDKKAQTKFRVSPPYVACGACKHKATFCRSYCVLSPHLSSVCMRRMQTSCQTLHAFPISTPVSSWRLHAAHAKLRPKSACVSMIPPQSWLVFACGACKIEFRNFIGFHVHVWWKP
jgi:hypothetical protein